MDIFNVIYSRRSIRDFSMQDIDDNSLMKILDAGRWAPSSCNQQLWHFIIVRDNNTKENLVNKAGSSAIILKSPVLIVSCYHTENMKEAIETISAATENMLLAATALGIGSLWLDSIGNKKTIKEILKIPKDYSVICFVLLGYAKGTLPKPPPRKDLGEIIHFEKFGLQKKESFSHNPDEWTLESIRHYQKYYCRKTALGIKMDVFAAQEAGLIRDLLSDKTDILDLFSYDGSLLTSFPDTRIWTMDLDNETSLYVSCATNKKIEKIIYEDIRIPLEDNCVKNVTCFYKIERIPKSQWKTLFKEVCRVLDKEGEFILIFRNLFSLYGLFYRLLLLLFKDNIKKTAIYSFFGPYKPLRPKELKDILGESGFNIEFKRCFLIPPFFEELYQLLLQYKISGGTSFLHRVTRETVLAKILKRYLLWQGKREFVFGSNVVIRARKV